ncbi:hypothetical protein SLEP1_g14966 [Rubroshorea leprosula]|uniref:Uncharacterized protein n=1 Tax=Rubroshorea leprosula TaxID=152421 RepID=A0AAV5IW96_9ROSI|nr:hypothetical protein SLEP1_g14966 [Rubroshorea leprosula]
MASWWQARPELSYHKDELKQLSSSKVVYLIQVDLGKGYHEDELKQLNSSEVYLIQVDLRMGYHKDELKQLSSFEVYLIQVDLGMGYHKDEQKQLSSSEVYLIQVRVNPRSFASPGVVHLELGCHEDELKHRLSSFEVVHLEMGYHELELIQGCLPHPREFTLEWTVISSKVVYLIQGSSPQDRLA